jgi:phytoene synthase
MTVGVSPWESKLLALASEGLKAQVEFESHALARTKWDDPLLQQAYAACADITRQNSHTFYLASGLLPQHKRAAARVLYAFCRLTDDVVDRRNTQGVEALQDWAKIALSDHPNPIHKVSFAWQEVRSRFQIPRRYAEQLIEGVAMDINHARYETFDDLVTYCYGVASTVGLMAMHIIGFNSPEAIRYAVRLGVALQLTNILRDIGEDWRNGRLYLPVDELQAFDLTEADIAQGVVDDRWRRFMRFQIERTREIYSDSLPGIQMLHNEGRFAIAAAALLYQAILEDIEANDYDVFRRRAFVSAWGKIRRLPLIWLKSL